MIFPNTVLDGRMNTLVYIPTGLASPELEILLAKAQAAIDVGEQTTVVTCSGGAGYACSLNIYGLRTLCGVCKAMTRRGLSLLQGEFSHLETPPRINMPVRDNARREILRNRWEIKKYVLDGVDVGQAAYSSYIGLSRDQDMEGRLALWAQNRLLATSEKLVSWFRALLCEMSANRVVLYNGRHNQYRPLLRLAQQENIPVDVMEFSGQDAGCTYTFQNELPQDIDVLNRYIEKTWQNYAGDVAACGESYYMRKRAGGVINDSKSYVLGQKQGLLPNGWDSSKHNVAVFNSSEDEYTALGGDYDKTLYINQTEAMTRICESLHDDPDIMIWLRIHPNLTNVRWSFAEKLLGLEKKHPNVRVIPGGSPVSSYGLLDACDTALSFGSTMGVEAVYAGKPSILVGRCVYERLGSVYTPDSHEEVVHLLRQRELPRLPIEGALKVALFWSQGGHAIPHFGGDRTKGFNFSGHRIEKTSFERFRYNFAKLVEKVLLGEVINYGLGVTKSSMRNGAVKHALSDR